MPWSIGRLRPGGSGWKTSHSPSWIGRSIRWPARTIEWILERYQVKTDKASGIRNDPNDWAAEHGDPEYILNLLGRIVTVSVETVAIVNALPALRIREAKRP